MYVCACDCVQVKGVMRENVNKVMERGDRLEGLEGKAGMEIHTAIHWNLHHPDN